MIPFNVPAVTGKEEQYLREAIFRRKLSGDGSFTGKCHDWFKTKAGARHALLTTSCTHALEMSAILADIRPGDEVIMPSYTFVSTANAFVLRGAKIVFVDVRPDTMNLDEKQVEAAITANTKAIVPVHYAGVACEMDTLLELAKAYRLTVIEDAAQGVMSTYKGKALGSIGQMGCYSFHETKNYNCGEGGAILFNDDLFIERAEIVREKGTDRTRFFRGQIDKYTWVDMGSSYLPSEINAAFLYAQLESAQYILDDRMDSWKKYDRELRPLSEKADIDVPHVPGECSHNAHMYYVKVKNLEERTRLLRHLQDCGVMAIFHYVPLHSSAAGRKYGRFHGEDRYTTKESERLIRLPLYYRLDELAIERTVDAIYSFFKAQGSGPNRIQVEERV